jgi:hypothetical protein
MSALAQDIHRPVAGSAAARARAAGRVRRAEQGALTSMARSLSLQARLAEGARAGRVRIEGAGTAGAGGTGIEAGRVAPVAAGSRSRQPCSPTPSALLRRRPLAARRA